MFEKMREKWRREREQHERNLSCPDCHGDMGFDVLDGTGLGSVVWVPCGNEAHVWREP